jgi:translation initiation factor 1 (eIF-1/SUI1)
MDPFNITTENLNTTIMQEELIPTIFCEKNGRKSNTYIINWNISDAEQKNHLEKMKKKFGTGGTVKTVLFEGKEYSALHIQGDNINKVRDYLVSLKIKNFIVKPII